MRAKTTTDSAADMARIIRGKPIKIEDDLVNDKPIKVKLIPSKVTSMLKNKLIKLFLLKAVPTIPNIKI